MRNGDYLSKLFNIKDKTVLLTGASGFLGRYMAKGLLSSGARLIIMGSSERIESLFEDLKSDYSKDHVFMHRVDFYDTIKLKKVLEDISDKFSPDVLVNNAYDLSPKTGFNTEDGDILNSDFEMWKNSFNSGIYWAVLATQIIGRKMLDSKKGSIINISSMYGIVVPSPLLYKDKDFFNPPTYATVKSGLIGFTKYVASFWGTYGIRCNAIAPGPFSNTEDDGSNAVNKNDDFLDRLKERTVLNRIGNPKELIGALIYLASDASSYMTGQVLVIDGGWTII